MPKQKTNEVREIYAKHVHKLFDIKSRLEQLVREIDDQIGVTVVLRDSDRGKK